MGGSPPAQPALFSPQAPMHDRDAPLHHLFEHTDRGLALLDGEGRLWVFNRRFVDLAGLTADEARPGTRWRLLLRELRRSGRLVRAADMPPGCGERRRDDGRAIEITAHHGDGLTSLVLTDVTARRAARAANANGLRTLRLLIEHTEQGVWTIDNELRTTDANPAMCRMLGLPLSGLLGRTIWEFVDETNAQVFRDATARRARGEASRYEITLTRGDGQPVHCLNNATPIFDAQGHKIGAIGLFGDITPLKLAEQRLAEQSRALAMTLDSLQEGVLHCDGDGRVLVWNRRLLELLQLPSELLQRRPTLTEIRDFQVARGDFVHDPVFNDPVQRLQLLPRYRRTRVDGLRLEVREHRAADGSIVRTYRDVTADEHVAEALRVSEQRFRSMADATPALIWQGAADGKAQWFNQRWLAYTGRSLEQELSLPWTARLHPDDYERCLQATRQSVAEGESFEIEYRIVCHDGQVRWVADHGIPRHDARGRFEGFTGYGWDITTRKAAEQALSAAKDEAERLSRAKSEFLSRMSHELRTPLNAVLGFAQLLASDTAEPLAPRQRERVQELQRGGAHLLNLINDVLDIARIEAGSLRLALAPVDLPDLARECESLLQGLMAAQGVQLRVQPGPAVHVQADRMRLKQVLVNLLSNAAKYNRSGGTATLRWLGPTQGRVRLEVVDEGEGISAEMQARLFQPFERLGAERAGIDGTGIGLALSKWLVEMMLGEIGVSSQPGRGAVFWIELGQAEAGAPLPAPPPPKAAVVPAPRPGQARRRVLYIEDNEVNRLLMQGMLAQRPAIDLVLAALPEEGLALACAEPPALVLLDIQLPGIDGFEVLARLRAHPATAAIPVVAVSANAMPADRERAAAAGFAEYVTKPIDLELLLTVVDRWLNPPSG
jgi:PAS domain S-box-containing protein